MKVRAGFVSNSSSSSFALFGASFTDWEDVTKHLKLSDDEKDGSEREIVEEKFKDDQYIQVIDTEYDGVYIGVYAGGIFDYMGDGETKKDVFARIGGTIKDRLNLKKVPGIDFHKGEYPS
jgi:hypothetical protein